MRRKSPVTLVVQQLHVIFTNGSWSFKKPLRRFLWRLGNLIRRVLLMVRQLHMTFKNGSALFRRTDRLDFDPCRPYIRENEKLPLRCNVTMLFLSNMVEIKNSTAIKKISPPHWFKQGFQSPNLVIEFHFLLFLSRSIIFVKFLKRPPFPVYLEQVFSTLVCVKYGGECSSHVLSPWK